MGSKFEKFSVIVFIFLTVFGGIFISITWGASITDYNINQFEIEDNTIVINGTIEDINKPNDNNFYVKISGKSYNIEDYFPCLNSWLGGSNDEDMELFYYTVEIGDNVTIYESNKIVLNGEVYQNSVFEDYSWFAWVIIFIPVIIVVISLIICLALVGSEKEELEDNIKGLKKKIQIFEREIAEEKAKREIFLVDNNTKLRASVFRQLYCNKCGSEVDLKESHCKYCGTEVRLE